MSSKQRQDHLLKVIASPRFLKKQGLGNEVPFFICPYPPEQAVEMEAVRANVAKQLGDKGVTALDINLYDLAIEMLKAREIWDQLLETETDVSKDELKELLQNVLDPEQHLVPEIAKRLGNARFDVLLLSGVGEVFPYIRSHNVLNNLQSTAKDQPTVMFFPGNYTHALASGAALDLFGQLHDDKYYRAFNIFNYEV
ncbi:MAG: hypothetical protein B7Y35_07470 [Sphingomonadales bacterium 28-64-96]|nr:MAG: hypothetical protein B7Y35_07470 [Sphingomonadales bacterium 28-64-96]